MATAGGVFADVALRGPGDAERVPGAPPSYFRFGVCESALAAAAFSAFVDFGLLRTADAALAAFGPV
jgi:hypothetical protein